ncbi:MAG TPA: hypothetical protein VGF29_11005 [Hyphomicrobiaceae bacterium]|jgi:hypothetical protein
MTVTDHLDASLSSLVLPDDLANLPPAQLRRLRDNAYVLQKACDQALARRICEPKAGILAELKNGRSE